MFKNLVNYLISSIVATAILHAGGVDAFSTTFDFDIEGGTIQDGDAIDFTFTDFTIDVGNLTSSTTQIQLQLNEITGSDGSYLSELELFLISPTNHTLTVAQLLTGNTLENTTLLDGNNLTNIDLGIAPYTGEFAPSGEFGFAQESNVSTFADFNSSDPNGTWTLRIYDTLPGNTGTFSGGTLILSTDSTSDSVPEPLTILGSVTALGFGVLLKRQSSRKPNKR
jgi:subtilisin-like proprotein convertase family protein